MMWIAVRESWNGKDNYWNHPNVIPFGGWTEKYKTIRRLSKSFWFFDLRFQFLLILICDFLRRNNSTETNVIQTRELL